MTLQIVDARIPERVTLRPEVELELLPDSPLEAVTNSIRGSFRAFEVLWSGKSLGWWGYAPVTVAGSLVQAWFLPTPTATNYPLLIALASRRAIDYLLERYPVVVCYADPRFEESIRWLEWLGFTKGRSVNQLIEMQVERR